MAVKRVKSSKEVKKLKKLHGFPFFATMKIPKLMSNWSYRPFYHAHMLVWFDSLWFCGSVECSRGLHLHYNRSTCFKVPWCTCFESMTFKAAASLEMFTIALCNGFWWRATYQHWNIQAVVLRYWLLLVAWRGIAAAHSEATEYSLTRLWKWSVLDKTICSLYWNIQTEIFYLQSLW